MKQFPKINVAYSSFLDEIYINYFTAENFKETKFFRKIRNTNILPKEKLQEKQKLFILEWKKYGEKIFESMYKATGLSFSRNIVDFYLVSISVRTFSNPIILSADLPVDLFFSIAIHELIHILFKEELGANLENMTKITGAIYETQSGLTTTHIPLYAVQFYILNQVFDDSARRIEIEKNQAKNHRTDEYLKAIEIVEKNGYENIIIRLKKEMNKKKRG